MNHFAYHKGVLHAEDVPLAAIAESVGTPTYVYSTATLTRHIRVVTEAFGDRPHLICYSVKANSNLAILRLIAERGGGFDIVSGGELARVRHVGGDAGKTVFAGVGKTQEEMEAALAAGILLFNVESAEELEALDAVGRRLGRRAPFALRVNPDVDARTHRYISTGLKTSKFGVPFEEAVALYARAKKMKGLLAAGWIATSARSSPRRRPFARPCPRWRACIPRSRKRAIRWRTWTWAAGWASPIWTRRRRLRRSTPAPCWPRRVPPGPRSSWSRAGRWWATRACCSRACCTGRRRQRGTSWWWTRA